MRIPEELELKVVPGEALRGSFVLESSDDRKIKGFLYSSSPRVVCEPAEFQGIKNEIRYQVDGNGFREGMEEEGFFSICCELGEYRLPYHLTLGTKKSREKEAISLESPEELPDLAQKEFQMAYRYFITESFRELLKEKKQEALGYYDSLAQPSFGYQSLEEFLIGIKAKAPVEITLDRADIGLSGLTEPVAERIELTKNTWGFQKISVESDARFLRPERKVITTDEFAGSTYGLNLVVDTNLMHGGRNYGRVTLSTPYQKLCVEVTAEKAPGQPAARQNHICKIMMKKLEGLYVGFRLKKIDLGTWVERSVNVINSYRRAGGADPFAELFLVQLYFADGKRQKAIKVLEGLEEHKERLDTPERYGFYLYMTTFFYQEASYVDQVEDEIRTLFYRDKTNWKLQWILLYLQESLLNDETAKYETVAEQFRYGCRSRIMYLEAYQILKSNPFLMRHLGSFELQLLRFAKKEQVLTAEVIRQVTGLTSHYGKYSGQLFEILRAGYEMYPSADVAKAICLLLMKGDRRDPEAFSWYEKGVDYGLRITGLYEYYMESTDQLDLVSMPQIIRMYFAYDTTLDYRKRAALYRRLVEQQEKDPQTFRNYRAAMEKFAVDQLEMGRFTEDLGVMYQHFLRKATMTRTMAEQLLRLLFTYEVTCDSPEIRSVTVHSGCLVGEQTYVFSEGRALVQIYDPDSVLVVEDREGTRHGADSLCGVRKVFDSGEMLEWCSELSPKFPGLVLFICAGSLKENILNRNTLPYLRTGCGLPELKEEFRDRLRGQVLHYYMEHPRDESLPEFLEGIPYLDYVKVDKAALITLLAEEGMCADAFSLLDMYGAEGIPLLQLVRISSRMVLDLEFAENGMLLSMCHTCFASGKYNDKLLRYLLLYYEGPIGEMKEVWEAAKKFELDTMVLEEKILMMILFTRSGTEGSEPVFESYRKKMGRKKLCRAYVNLKAYEYFVRGLPVAESIFRYVERDYLRQREKGALLEQEEVCRLALLQYYSGLVERTPQQNQCAAELLEEFSAKGMRFAFWKRFDRELLAPYQMDGRVFVEYVGNPASLVNIFYRGKGSGEEYRKEAVKNCFEGIFVKEFTLFYGDELECYLEEETDGKVKKSDLRSLTWDSEITEGASQYELLNRISRVRIQGEEETLDKEMENYLLLEYLARELFTLV